mgnify:FL=1
MRIIFFIFIFLFFASKSVLASDPDGFIKKLNKHRYIQLAEWINDKTVDVIGDPRISLGDLWTGLNRICSMAKKYELKGIEIRIINKSDKVLKKKKCK